MAAENIALPFMVLGLLSLVNPDYVGVLFNEGQILIGVGLATPYLSDEWMGCIAACIDEAKQLGMEAWLYDEDRWPSGAAGGLVTKEERFRQRGLVCAERAKGAG